MCGGPFLDHSERGPGLYGTGQECPVKGECRLLALMLRVEVRDAVPSVEHPDNDSKEDRNNWHLAQAPIVRETGA
jgi:hypothetical protein